MFQFKGIHHLALVTRDMDKTIYFWRDLLGMRLVAGLGEPGYRHYFFEISENDFLAFFEWPDAAPVPERDHGYPAKGPRVFDHISFGLAGEEELWALQSRLSAADFPVSGVIDHGFIKSIYTWDPNGAPIEFSVGTPGVDVRRDPQMRDKSPTQAAEEGPEPIPGRWPPSKPTPANQRRVYPGAGSELFHGVKDPEES
jgi:catechol 2,3-dioxygenase-like lactoylglutathione lyase family enzyme